MHIFLSFWTPKVLFQCPVYWGNISTLKLKDVQYKLSKILNAFDKVIETIVKEFDNKLEIIIYILKVENQAEEALKTLDELIKLIN